VLGRAGIGLGTSQPITEAVRGAVAGVVKAIKSMAPVSDREEAIIRVEKKLKVDAERDSTVILVRFDSKTPQLAQAVCDAIVNVYQQEHLRIHRNPESSAFFEDQRELLRAQLDEALERVRQAKSEFGLADIGGRRDTLESQRSAIELESYKAEQELATAEARVADLERQLEHVPERMISAKTKIPNQGADLLREQLYALQVKSMDLKARYNDAHPLVAAIEQQIGEAEKVIQAQKEERMETTDDINPIHQKLSLELKQQSNVIAGLAARLKRLGEQQDTVLAELRDVNVHEVKLDQLEREAHVARTKFYQYAESLEQARIDQVLARQSISNVSIPQPATLAEKPVSPSKLVVGLATLAIALGGTSTLILASERLNDRMRTDQQVEEVLQVPVFATIPSNSASSRVLVS
jgi:uncharacterized protein involved in exopolysaccharide biosynthesis